MKRKINIQLIGIALIAITATMLLMSAVFYELFREQVQEDLKINAEILQGSGTFQEDYISSLKIDMNDLRVTWIANDGTVLYDNDANVLTMGNHLDRPEVSGALQKGNALAVRKSSTLNKDTFYYALKLEDGSVLRVARVASNIWSIVGKAIPVIAAIILVMIVICIILAHLLTKNIINPIEEMTVNIDDYSVGPVYKELVPFVETIRGQHEDILKNARMRQDFTANVSHELKTPLTAISGYAELIENDMAGPEDIKRFSSEIDRNANRLLYLINDIIRLSELDNVEDAVTFELFDLYETATACVNSLKMNAEKNNVHINIDGSSTVINANKDMISELITNLCDNAIRYNTKNGSVNVTVKKENDRGVLIVRDNGIGIPEESKERVFERFYRVDKSRSKQTGGTGLGLAIVKHIASIHDAKLTLDSKVGEGTCITVRF